MYLSVSTQSSFVQELITDAIIEQDAEKFSAFDDLRIRYWQNILKVQHDLIHYGGFSYCDTEQIPLIEKSIFMDYTIERKKEDDETMGSAVAGQFAVLMGFAKKKK